MQKLKSLIRCKDVEMQRCKENKTFASLPLYLFASKAFSLAEMLIAICIIGIIVEITIPDLIYYQQKQTTTSSVKTIYNILDQATKMIAMDCGGDLANCLADPNADDNDNNTRKELANLYKNKFTILKDCTTTTTAGCFANKMYIYLDRAADANFETRSYYANAKIVLRNGITVGFDWNGKTDFPPYYFIIPVDINNTDGPNQVGKDTFFFYYDMDKKCIKPYPTLDCGTGTNDGTGCSQRIIQESGIYYY